MKSLVLQRRKGSGSSRRAAEVETTGHTRLAVHWLFLEGPVSCGASLLPLWPTSSSNGVFLAASV